MEDTNNNESLQNDDESIPNSESKEDNMFDSSKKVRTKKKEKEKEEES